jgi:alpha-L-rhamnosidase
VALSGLVVAPGAVHAADAAITAVTDLTVNGRTNPLGIPGDTPAFGWQLRATGRGVAQASYVVQVSTKADFSDILWTGTGGAEQVDLAYGGPALVSSTRYHWRVQAADQNGTQIWSQPAWFETGLLAAADWNTGGAARWIGKTAPPVWDDYTVDVEFKEIPGEPVGLLFRMNDSMTSGYMWQYTSLGGPPRMAPHDRNPGWENYDGQSVYLSDYDPKFTPNYMENDGPFAGEPGWHKFRLEVAGTTIKS